ncbi:helix-turn-helix transcriptional regulator [Halalkalibacterium halodurans]|nr:helix-turn-helix transcriptional regulator [Halalkalibacterium halodurans]
MDNIEENNRPFGHKLKELRKSHNLTQEELVTQLNKNYSKSFNKGMISKWENNREDPRMDSVRCLADFFNVSLNELLEIKKPKESKLPSLTPKDELDIQKELQKMIDGLNSKDGLAAFDGQSIDELDEEDRELLIASLEQSLRIAKRMAKQKFAPKKYRK